MSVEVLLWGYISKKCTSKPPANTHTHTYTIALSIHKLAHTHMLMHWFSPSYQSAYPALETRRQQQGVEGCARVCNEPPLSWKHSVVWMCACVSSDSGLKLWDLVLVILTHILRDLLHSVQTSTHYAMFHLNLPQLKYKCCTTSNWIKSFYPSIC